jgi:hypothetical protein
LSERALAALAAGETLGASYADPADPTDTSSTSILVVAGKLEVERFYASAPGIPRRGTPVYKAARR